MNKQEHIKHWISSAEHDLETVESLFENGKYDWCLFIGHLVIEKILKAKYVQDNNNMLPPKTHNLIRLAEETRLKLDEETVLFLDEVNEYNLEVRYPEFRKEFYKICNKEFAAPRFLKIKEIFQWLKSQIT